MSFQGIMDINSKLIAKLKCGCTRKMICGSKDDIIYLRKEIARALSRPVKYIKLYRLGFRPLKNHDSLFILKYKRVNMSVGPQGCSIHGNYVINSHNKKTTKTYINRRIRRSITASYRNKIKIV